jgi:hypothetical protein
LEQPWPRAWFAAAAGVAKPTDSKACSWQLSP